MLVDMIYNLTIKPAAYVPSSHRETIDRRNPPVKAQHQTSTGCFLLFFTHHGTKPPPPPAAATHSSPPHRYTFAPPCRTAKVVPFVKMIYTAIDTFYLTDDQIQNSPSRKDNIDEETEITLRIYGCDLIQESGILLKLPQAAMATGQVLFHRFFCKKSFGRFDVKRVAASCIWLASKLEECPKKARHVIIVLHRMECRRENLPIGHLDLFSKKYSELKMDLIRTERHLLKEMGFICHVEHPHKFISNYLATLGTPPELRQEAWNLANDSLRTTLCVRFRSEVVACGVVYAAARRFQVPLPENPPWWKAFDADKSGIDEVCRVLAHLYSRPKAKYIPVCKDAMTFTSASKSAESRTPKDASHGTPCVDNDVNCAKTLLVPTALDSSSSKDAILKQVPDKLKDPKKSDDDKKNVSSEGEGREDHGIKSKSEPRTVASGERARDRDRDRDSDRDRDRERDKLKSRDRESRDRRRDSDRERDRDEPERDRDKAKEKSHRSRPKESVNFINLSSSKYEKLKGSMPVFSICLPSSIHMDKKDEQGIQISFGISLLEIVIETTMLRIDTGIIEMFEATKLLSWNYKHRGSSHGASVPFTGINV
ncbi:hypothetical protein V2J09_006407 [Rumex salicifolius]